MFRRSYRYVFSFSKLMLPGILVFCSGCAIFGRAPLPSLKGEPLAAAQANAVLERLRMRTAEVHSLRVLSRAHIKARGERASLRYIVVFEKPRRLRIEAIPTNAMYTLALLAQQEHEAVYIDQQEQRAYRSDSADQLVREMLRLPISAEQFMNFISGRVDPVALSRVQQVKVYGGGGSYAVVKGDFEQYYLIDADDHTPRAVELRDGRTLLLKVLYGSFRKVGKVKLPLTMHVEIPEDSASLDLDLSSVTVNRNFPDKLFSTSVPEGYRVNEVR